MKKLLLLIPFALFTAIGVYSITATPTPQSSKSIPSVSQLPKDNQALFSFAERNIREMIRHGDEKSTNNINQSLDALSLKLHNTKKKGFNINKVEEMLLLYKQDTSLVCTKFTPKLKELHHYSRFEEEREKEYLTSIEQIGLYELKAAYADLDKIRQNYIREPSEEMEISYISAHKHLKEIIAELYLDNTIEEPLFSYLANHKHYLTTVSVTYNDIGIERINRLRSNGYAIKAEIQLLPTS